MKYKKATVEEIRVRFDQDVERFSNPETGQVSTVDAALSLEMLTETAKRLVPEAARLLDVGCGAGNYTLKMLSKLPDLDCTLLDLSKPMLDKAFERVSAATTGTVEIIQSDIRTASLPAGSFDLVVAGAVLHHLREDADWTYTFTKLYRILKPGGCLLISDLVSQDSPVLDAYISEKYGDYLESMGGARYRDKVFDYIEKEDTPRPLTYQLNLMKNVGFRKTDVLHKNLCFATFLGIK